VILLIVLLIAGMYTSTSTNLALPVKMAAAASLDHERPLATSFLLQTVQRTPASSPTPTATAATPATIQPSHDAPIFPSVGAQVRSAMSGPFTIKTLSPQDMPGPIKPLNRTEIDGFSKHLNFRIGFSKDLTIRISVFRTTADAATALTWLFHHLLPDHRFLPSGAGPQRYSVGGYNVVAMLYRNVELVASAPVATMSIDDVADADSDMSTVFINPTEEGPSPAEGPIMVRPSRAKVGQLVTVSGRTIGPSHFQLPPGVFLASLARLQHPASHNNLPIGPWGANGSCTAGNGQLAVSDIAPVSSTATRPSPRGLFPKNSAWSVTFRVPATMDSESPSGRATRIPTPPGTYVLLFYRNATDGFCVSDGTYLNPILTRLTILK
jgi:hypothetical protein